jgi:hypothetical protein
MKAWAVVGQAATSALGPQEAPLIDQERERGRTLLPNHLDRRDTTTHKASVPKLAARYISRPSRAI